MPEPISEETGRRIEARLEDLTSLAKFGLILSFPLLILVLAIDRLFARLGVRRDIFWWPLKPPRIVRDSKPETPPIG